MNPEKRPRHRNELTPSNQRIIEDSVRIAEVQAIIASADEQIETLIQEGRHDVAALLRDYRDTAKKEYNLRETLREQARFTTKRELLHDDADAEPGSTVTKESVAIVPQPGTSAGTIEVLQDLIDEVFAQREFYHQVLQEQFPDENAVINKKLREMKNNGPVDSISTNTS